ncbi:RNA polymerase sigma factor [Streptomyces sp. 4N509B]|uniref:RNA polymerase sigma factor n=1 Tax=Streptomyces sp. 4N509B TaxID=3457413 RepID=UPI003FD2B0C5
MRRHDEERFREFAAGQARPLRRTAYLLCGDWHLAEDLTQSVLIRMYRSWPRLERRGELGPYVRRVLVRAWLDEGRRPWRRERAVATLPDAPDPAATGPDDVASHLDARNAVHRALLALPPRQRATLVLRYFDDLSVAQTAAALGCSEGNVKSQTARGLTTLRTHLERSEVR